MNSTKLMIAAAAMGGLLAGAAMNVSASTSTRSQNATVQSQLGSKVAANALDKHDCKGMNSCKGQGGCKTGDNGCKGKNSCKGNGGCKVSELL
jgi:hypothetical protein